LYGIVTHSGASLTSGHYLAYVRSMPSKTEKTLSIYPDITPDLANQPKQGDTQENIGKNVVASDNAPVTRKKTGVPTKLPSRFTENIIANTKVKAFENVAPKKMKIDLADSLKPARAFSTEWFECDDETVRVFEGQEFLKLLSGDTGALLGTPYLLFYHKATFC